MVPTYDQAAKVTANIDITFEGPKVLKKVFRKQSIPMFLGETRYFLADVIHSGEATWSVFFAPFLDGIYTKGTLTLMMGSHDHRSGLAVEVLDDKAIDNLQKILKDFSEVYGILVPKD